jgi:hypothetical protein
MGMPLATVAVALACTFVPALAGSQITPKPPYQTAAVMHLSLEDRLKFGWGEHGLGPKLTRRLRDVPYTELAAMARSGDAEAAYILWQLLQSDQRLADAEHVALEQGRVNGHTFLIATMGARYQSESSPRELVLYKVCELMGDGLCARKYASARVVWQPDDAAIEREARALLEQMGR